MEETGLKSVEATSLISDCYAEIARYSAKTRVYASAIDGMKAVYRRMVYASRIYNKRVKSAVITGETLKYHPHAESYGTLVEMTCKFNRFYIYDGKGNFGDENSGAAACFTGDTKITVRLYDRYSGEELSNDMDIPIKDIVDSIKSPEELDTEFRVRSCNTKTGVIEWKRITNASCNGERQVITLIFSNGTSVRCTPDHRFLTYDGRNYEYVEAQNIDVGRPYLKTVFNTKFELINGQMTPKFYRIRVDYIVYTGEYDKVYDIEVEDNHNFGLADAKVIVHNSRYTEDRLSDLGRLMYLELVDYAEYVDGEAGNKEPHYLPALIPWSLLVGCTGLPVGLPLSNIPSYNAIDLINFIRDKLNQVENPRYPMIDYGGVLADATKEEIDLMSKNGYGKVRFRPIITKEDYNKFVVTESTPSCSLQKLVKKLSSKIESEEVEFVDETSKDGNRYVFYAIGIEPDELYNLIWKYMSCTKSYKFITEYNDHVYYCGIDFIIDHQIDYLKQCVVRKFTSYIDKTKYQLEVLNVIKVLKSSKLIYEISKLSKEELIEELQEYEFDYNVCNEALKKPISYLTKSHDEEIKSLEESLVVYQNYLENPQNYLLELYDKLEVMIKDEIYNHKKHTILLSDYANVNQKLKVNIDTESNSLVFKVTKSPSYHRFNNTIYLVSSEGYIKKLVIDKSGLVSNNEDLISVDIEDEIKYDRIITDTEIGDKSDLIVLTGTDGSDWKGSVSINLNNIVGSTRLFKSYENCVIDEIIPANENEEVKSSLYDLKFNVKDSRLSRIAYPKQFKWR